MSSPFSTLDEPTETRWGTKHWGDVPEWSSLVMIEPRLMLWEFSRLCKDPDVGTGQWYERVSNIARLVEHEKTRQKGDLY